MPFFLDESGSEKDQLDVDLIILLISENTECTAFERLQNSALISQQEVSSKAFFVFVCLFFFVVRVLVYFGKGFHVKAVLN